MTSSYFLFALLFFRCLFFFSRLQSLQLLVCSFFAYCPSLFSLLISFLADYKHCFEVLASIKIWSPHFEGWIANVCYQKQTYGPNFGNGDMTLVTPCPSHVICSVLTPVGARHPGSQEEALPYCPRPLAEYSEQTLHETPPNTGPMPTAEDLRPIRLMPTSTIL